MSMKRPFGRHEARRLTVPAAINPGVVYELRQPRGRNSWRILDLYSTHAKAVEAGLALLGADAFNVEQRVVK